MDVNFTVIENACASYNNESIVNCTSKVMNINFTVMENGWLSLNVGYIPKGLHYIPHTTSTIKLMAP